MLDNIQSQVMSYAAQAGAWIQSQIAVAQTSQYGIVRFLATNATPKTAIVSALGVAAAFCFGKSVQNYVNRNGLLLPIPVSNGSIVKNGNIHYATEHDIAAYKQLRERSKTENLVAYSHMKASIGWAVAGVALTAAAVAVAILMPTP